MAARFPVFPLLWIFTIGLVPAGGCGEPSDGADRSPAFVSSEEPASASAAPSQAQAIFEAAVRTLESHEYLSAKIVLEGHLFDTDLVGQGIYLQQRSAPQCLMRLELRMQHGDQTSSLVQVCDGRYLWERRNLPGEEIRGRIDVARATRGLEGAEKLRSSGKAGFLPGLGGLPRLMRSLGAACDFTSAQQTALRVGPDELPVWQLRGQWKRDRLTKLLGNPDQTSEAAGPPDLKKLPPYLFDQVILMVGQEDLFPYRIEYRRAVAGKALQSDPHSSRPLVTTQLHDVVLNAPIDPGRFRYNPGSFDYPDRTGNFLKSLGAKQ